MGDYGQTSPRRRERDPPPTSPTYPEALNGVAVPLGAPEREPGVRRVGGAPDRGERPAEGARPPAWDVVRAGSAGGSRLQAAPRGARQPSPSPARGPRRRRPAPLLRPRPSPAAAPGVQLPPSRAPNLWPPPPAPPGPPAAPQPPADHRAHSAAVHFAL